MALLMGFRKSVRPWLLQGEKSKNFFVTRQGNGVESSRVSRIMASFLKKTGIPLAEGKTFKSTTVRKMWVTHLKAKGATDAELQDLATLMKHSRRTQDAWYDLTLKGRHSRRACINISNELNAAQPNLQPRTEAKEAEAKEAEAKEAIQKDSCEDTNEKVDQMPCESPHRKFHGARYPWKRVDEDALKMGMALLLARSSYPKKKEIENAFVDGPSGVYDIWKRYDCPDWRHKCIEKIRNLYRNQNK